MSGHSEEGHQGRVTGLWRQGPLNWEAAGPQPWQPCPKSTSAGPPGLLSSRSSGHSSPPVGSTTHVSTEPETAGLHRVARHQGKSSGPCGWHSEACAAPEGQPQCGPPAPAEFLSPTHLPPLLGCISWSSSAPSCPLQVSSRLDVPTVVLLVSADFSQLSVSLEKPCPRGVTRDHGQQGPHRGQGWGRPLGADGKSICGPGHRLFTPQVPGRKRNLVPATGKYRPATTTVRESWAGTLLSTEQLSPDHSLCG